MGFLRHPKTTQERRRFFGDQAERRDDPLIPELRRKRRSIPNAWDDIWVESERCWKSYRKTQWRDRPKRKKKRAKFRGHLNPRWLTRRTKKTWYWNYERHRLCWRYELIWYCEATGKKLRFPKEEYDYERYREWLEANGFRPKTRYYSELGFSTTPGVARGLLEAKAAEDGDKQESIRAATKGAGGAAKAQPSPEEVV
jgi:hypothetical protein